MKRFACLLLALLMVLSMTACGNTAPVEQNSAPATEAPTEATESVSAVFADSPVEQELREQNAQTLCSEDYQDFLNILYEMGFYELQVEYHKTSLESQNWPSVLREMTYSEDEFRLVLDYENYNEATGETEMVEGWIIYGAKSDRIQNISGIDAADYGYCDEFDWYKEFPENDDGYRQWVEYTYGDPGMVICRAIYYPESGNLYNIVKAFEEPPMFMTVPRMLIENREDMQGLKAIQKEKITVDGYTMELAEFTLHWGENSETYRYRIGMSFSDWAASELNTGGWVAGFEGGIYSPDYRYAVFSQIPDITYSVDLYNNVYAVENVPEVSLYPASVELMEWGMSSDFIAFGTAHLVNWQTPLLTPGFKIMGEYEFRSDYYMFDLGSNFIAGEKLNIYMKQVDKALLPDIKLYIFKESQEMVDLIREGTMASHTHPLAADSPLLAIPENATCLTFEPADPNRDQIYYADRDVVVARYDMSADPNFSPVGENVYAITYRDQLVYWIHVPVYDSGFLYQDMIDMSQMTETEEKRTEFKMKRSEIMSDLYTRSMVARENFFNSENG